jgi:pentatricopeptide repeat protein
MKFICLKGYLNNHRAQQAFDLFFKISHPTPISYTLFFNTCAQLGDETSLKAAQEIFRKLSSRNNFRDLDKRILNSALDMFVKCNDIDSAEALFPQLKRDVVSFGLLMKMYNSRNQMEKTFALFKQMKSEKVLPNNQIYVLLINACARLGDLSACESIIGEIPQQSFDDLWISNSLIDMWGKAGCPENAQLIFEKLSNPDAISFSSMSNKYLS